MATFALQTLLKPFMTDFTHFEGYSETNSKPTMRCRRRRLKPVSNWNFQRPGCPVPWHQNFTNMNLVGGWTNPSEKYVQVKWESFPQGSGWKFQKYSKPQPGEIIVDDTYRMIRPWVLQGVNQLKGSEVVVVVVVVAVDPFLRAPAHPDLSLDLFQ